MKKLLAVLLALVMVLSGLSAFAEEEVKTNEELFKEGLMALISSIAPGQMVTETVEANGQEMARVTQKLGESLYELTVEAPTAIENGVQVQLDQEGVYAVINGMPLHLAFADVEGIIKAVMEYAQQYGTPALPPELMEALSQISPETLQAIGQLLLNHLMAGMRMQGTEDGMVITYEASGKELIAALAAFLDDVAANEEYAAALSNIAVAALVMSNGTTEGIPTAQELVDNWPMFKEQLLSVETDFALAFRAFIASNNSRIDVEGSMGVPQDTYLMAWHYVNDAEKGEITLDGKLTERWQRNAESEPRDYDIDIHFDLSGSSVKSYNFSINYPSQGFIFKLSGTQMDGMGRLDAAMTTRGRMAFQLKAFYGFTRDGLMLNGDLVTMRGRFGLDLTASKNHGSLKLLQNGREFVNAEVWLDENYNVTGAKIVTDAFTADYDGEKLVIAADGTTVTCTAEYEAENLFVITMHAEGENIPEGQDYAYFKVEYTGSEGNWEAHAVLIDPTGAEIFRETQTVAPMDPIVPIAETYAGQIFEINADTVIMMLNSMMSQAAPTLGE